LKKECGTSEESANVLPCVLAITVGRSLNLTKQRPVTCPIGPKEFHQMENKYEQRLNEGNKIEIYVM